MKHPILLLCLSSFTFLAAPLWSSGTVYEHRAKNTITPVEMDIGDSLHFTLHNGERRELELIDSGADILLTNVYPEALKEERPDHGVMYQVWIDVEIDGEPMRLTRYLCSQFSYGEPYYVNGMRIWFEYNRKPGAFMTQNRGGYPGKEARIVVNDMTDRIAPDPFVPWYRRNGRVAAKEFANERIDARDNYKGDDMHMGGYFGATPHNGLDINMPRGTEMVAPIDFDEHMLVSNLRWRGIRRWDNGSEWWLQSHHLFRMIAPQYEALKQGTVYAEGAGFATGEAAHSHFVLRVKDDEKFHTVDAWLIFWQSFRDLQDARGDIRASMAPFSPAKTGERVSFSSEGSRSGSKNELLYSWSFGDGATSIERNPTHAYAKPGMYAVRLTVDDGEHLAHFVQNITVEGPDVERPVVALTAEDAVEFRPWPSEATLLYAAEPAFMTHTLRFTARPSRPVPATKQVNIVNLGGGELSDAKISVRYLDGENWCSIHLHRRNDAQLMEIGVDATSLKAGVYLAEIAVEDVGALNGSQGFRVRLEVPEEAPEPRSFIMLNSDPGFFATPWFWVPHSFTVNQGLDISINAGRWDRPMLPPALLTEEGKNRMGLSDRYRSNGYRAEPDQFFRFTPDLAAGTYRISTPEETPWDETTEVNVRVRHADGDSILRYRPGRDPVIGTFTFEEGRDGFLEFYAEDSVGQVTADALVFENVEFPFASAEETEPVVEEIDGLIAHWSFERETHQPEERSVLDSVKGLPLAVHGGKKDADTWTQGKVGDFALSLDRRNAFATAEALGLDSLQPRTICGWVRMTSVEQPDGAVLFGFDGEADDTALRLSIPRFGNRVVADIKGFAWTVQAERDTEWHHFALVWDGASLYGYLDGAQTIKAGNLVGKETDDRFVVGSEDPSFAGKLDDIRVYGRALSAKEVQTIYREDAASD